MGKFLINIKKFGLVPLIILLTIYIYLDPFKVIYSYDTFFDEKNSIERVGLNKDYVSTTTLIKNRKKSNTNYNSFIFGNSRSIFYQVLDWKKFLSPKSNCYHFDASGEALYALNKKVEFINNQDLEIKNVLLILDYETLSQDKPKSGHLFIISPILVGNKNLIDFHLTFFKAFLSQNFLFAYLDFMITGKVKPYMKEKNLINDIPINYDIKTNEIRYDVFEDLIRKNQYYNSKRLSVFYKRDSIQKYSPISINVNQRAILSNIQNIFKKHKTKVKIIINPLYNQKKLNDKDLSYLKKLFGTNNVFDFSGTNKFTNSYKNYYESSHYRPHVAREIIKEVYRN